MWDAWTDPEKLKQWFAPVLHDGAAAKAQHEDMGFREGWGAVLDQMVAFTKG